MKKQVAGKITGTAFVLGLCSILVKITSFVRDIVLSYIYGAGTVSDAYLVAVSIPTVLFTGILTAIYTSYIPMYHEICQTDTRKINRYTSNLINITTILAALIVVFFFMFQDSIVSLFASGFNEETFQLTKTLSGISIFAVIFMAGVYVLQGFLQASNRFYLVALFLVPVNLIIAIGIVVSYQYNNRSFMTAAVVIAYFLIVPIFFIESHKSGFSYELYVNFQDPYLKRTIITVIPIFMGQMLAEINNIVDKNMASRLPSGSVTALDYGFKVGAMVYGILAWPIATVLYPKVSAFLAGGRLKDAENSVRKSLELMGFIIIPVTVMVVILSEPIIGVLFFRGAFGKEEMRITAQVLAVYVISAIPISYRIILEKAYYAMKETKKTVIFSGIGIIVNIVLDLVLLKSYAHIGLAFATTCSCVVTTLCYTIWIARKRMHGLLGKELLISTVQAVGASIVMGEVLNVLKHRFFQNVTENTFETLIKLILVTGISIIIYSICWIILEKAKEKFFKTNSN